MDSCTLLPLDEGNSSIAGTIYNKIGNEVKLMPGGYFPVQGNEGAGSVLHTLFQVPGYFVLLRGIVGDCLNLRAGQ
jgi:hypothetical protein